VRSSPRLSLVIPAHNEEATIAHTLAEYVDYLKGWGERYEILVVLNGCHDRTLEEVQAFGRTHPNVRWALIPEAGKGRAVKFGFQIARGDLIGFVDADGQIPAEEFERLLCAVEREPAVDGVIASKYKASGDRSCTSLVRWMAGRAFGFLARWLLRLPFRDTQCGAKIFRREALHSVLEELGLSGWTFDVELLLRLHRRGRRIAEVPITLRSSERPSQLSFLRVAPRMFRELLLLRDAVGALGSPAPNGRASHSQRRLGEILCNLGKLGSAEIQAALERQREDPRRKRLGEILVQMGLVAREDVQLALALQGV
jgi:glycosyltransferase involved in cell wall biosynthesis